MASMADDLKKKAAKYHELETLRNTGRDYRKDDPAIADCEEAGFTFDRSVRLKAEACPKGGFHYRGNEIGAMIVGKLGNDTHDWLMELKQSSERGGTDDQYARELGIDTKELARIEREARDNGIFAVLRKICGLEKKDLRMAALAS